MKNLFVLLLTLCCLLAGYAFYRMNNGDIFNAVCFTFGISGIMLSVVRNSGKSKSTDSDPKQTDSI